MENASHSSFILEAVVLVKCANQYGFFSKSSEDGPFSILSLRVNNFSELRELDASLRQLVYTNVKRTVKSVYVAGVEVGQFGEGRKKDAVGLRLVTIAIVSEDDGMPGNIASSCKVQWLEPQGIAQIIGSEPSILQPARDIYRWRALCEENPTRLAISAVIGLTQGFVPVVTTQPKPDEVDGCVQKETLLQGRDAAILGSKEDELLRKSKIGPVELSQIASEFSAHCGSGTKRMKKDVFVSFVSKIGISPNAANDLYRAFGGGDEGLTLLQLQMGVAAMEPATPHGGICGQVRAEMIFEYYNKRENGTLNLAEFRNLLTDIYCIKNVRISQESLSKMVDDQFKLFELNSDKEITLNSFLSCVGQLKFRGTSSLLRLPKPLFGQKEGQQVNRPPSPIHVPPDNNSHSDAVQDNKLSQASGEEEVLEKLPYRGRRKALSMEIPEEMEISPSEGTKETITEVKSPKRLKLTTVTQDQARQMEEFSIATHFVKVRRNGLLVDVSTLWDFISTEAVTGSVRNILSHSKPGVQRQGSIFAFDPKSAANQMLGMLRYFEQSLSQASGHDEEKAALSWGAVEKENVGSTFLKLCSRVQDILAQEDRLVQMKSPVYVLGDFHGNFQDLVCFEKVLWRLGPLLTPASFLFLGDYVDRGPHGFEVIAYLFAQKVLCPHKMILIRGNHEHREMQLNFSFQTECIEKFGESLGLRIWQTVNECFDVMPVSAVVEDKIFCTHGGIPRPCHGGGLLSAIREAPIVLSDPEIQCPLVWELMWSDPIRGDDISKEVLIELRKNNGFIPNPSRGTGYLFSGEALEGFLQRNNLSHVIRAHEVKATGFQLQHKGRLLTVFSSSGYCGGTNEAACVLIEGRKIRTIRLDTT